MDGQKQKVGATVYTIATERTLNVLADLWVRRKAAGVQGIGNARARWLANSDRSSYPAGREQ
jgi:hypothetical protein